MADITTAGGAGACRLWSFKHLYRHLSPPILALFLLCLIIYNGSAIFLLRVPVPAREVQFQARMMLQTSPETTEAVGSRKSTTFMMAVLKEETPVVISTTHSQKSENPTTSRTRTLKRSSRRRSVTQFKTLRLESHPKGFASRVSRFFEARNGSVSLCEVRFFMTWISSTDSFGDRELLAVQSLFNSNPRACLAIISSSMDSKQGTKLLRPFTEMGFRVIPISPDFLFLFKNTPAESWFDQLRKGHVNPGDIALGQNISNLLRLALLYKFGGTYIDTDVIILKNFSALRNVIGAQTMDFGTKNWTRLNNAVMVFDKKHPLVYEFIREFALTFDGNKWGHNGPYLVSRVVSRVSDDGAKDYNFTVLPAHSFYPVEWSRVGSIFEGPIDEKHSKWVSNKLRQIWNQSYAIHLWNRQSKMLKIEDGSIIGQIIANITSSTQLRSAL